MKRKLLIVDDQIEITNIVAELLSDFFDEIISVGSVKEAKAQLQQEEFVFIILDINLEGRNGAEVLKFLKDNPDNPNSKTPSIILSGLINLEFIERNKSRFEGILMKPFDHDELRNLVDVGLKKQVSNLIDSIVNEF